MLSKAKRLLIPQITLSLTIVVLKCSQWLAEGNSLKTFDFLSCFGFWFLPVLFLSSLLFLILSVIFDLNNWKMGLFILVISFIVAGFTAYTQPLSNCGIIVDWLVKTPVAFFFYFCGNYMNKVVLRPIQCTGPRRGLVLIALIPLLYTFSQLNGSVKMYLNDYGNVPLFFLSSFVGIFLVMTISKSLTNTSFLQEMGKLSISVYVWNFLIVGASLRVVNLALNRIGFNNSGIYTALTFFIAIFALYYISIWTYNKMPFLYGLKSNKT